MPIIRKVNNYRDRVGLGIDVLRCQRSSGYQKQPNGAVHYTEVLDSRNDSFVRMHREAVEVKPALLDQFQGIVRQAYDYSCGSAALTTLLNGYVGTQLDEQQVMSGLMKFGETDKIVERRSFSLLDMKRFVSALGLESGGYRGEFKDLVNQDQPAIVPISYAGFKHFVVYKGYKMAGFMLQIQHLAISVLMSDVFRIFGKITPCS